MKLVIVESPTKAKTITKFLGKEYAVESSYGHIRDLPKSKLGIDILNGFAPTYIIPKKAQPRVTALKKLVKKSEEIILATDEDREGEAIAWHLVQALGLGTKDDPTAIQRIVFHEITEHAIRDALTNPRAVNQYLVDAQQARRVLDRLVGYKLSPFLWKKIARGLSAGRVQSVALRLIAEREEEIKKFVAEAYWTIEVSLKSPRGEFSVLLAEVNGKPLEKFDIKTKARAEAIAEDLRWAEYKIARIERKEARRNPLPPFTTSTLQQTAAKRLGMSSKKTMYLAQALYENGLITYMRTDAVHLSQESLAGARAWIKKSLGERYLIETPRQFANKSRLAQEAHEAIRPTDASAVPEAMRLDKNEARLYDLIWRRFIASQLPPAIFDATHLEVSAKQKDAYLLSANGTTLVFDGFLKIWPTKFEERELPPLEENDTVSFTGVTPEEHFTEPPPRYNEASLIKTLEKYGIGRPSTYAPTISVIQARNYVEKQQGRFYPTEIGTLVNKVLTENFPEIVDIDFTAKMEEELDDIAEGKAEWQKVMKDFYDPFSRRLEEKYETVSKKEIVNETTDEVCEKCGKPMVIKFGRFGKFMACSGFPECKNAKTLKETQKSSGVKCPKCLDSPERKNDPGELIERRARKGRARGKIFWGCSKYPACDFAVWQDPAKTPPLPLGGKEHADS
jgi:DNA topoisomerase-1